MKQAEVLNPGVGNAGTPLMF